MEAMYKHDGMVKTTHLHIYFVYFSVLLYCYLIAVIRLLFKYVGFFKTGTNHFFSINN